MLLLVEDDAIARYALHRLLESAGYPVRTAEDGAAAWAELEAAPLPRLIILDLDMPGMDGRDFLRRLRGDPERGGLPVILLTGSPWDRELVGAADWYCRKPCDLELLLRIVRAYCR